MQVGQIDIVAVEGLEVAAVDGGTARREGVALWQKLLPDKRIVDDRADLAADEITARAARDSWP